MGTFPDPASVLPHRPPFLFVDEVIALDPGVSGTGLRHLKGDESGSSLGHFPVAPRCPAC
jgi:3-hydroxyacyl-[acyl-carrier-protein] dehydratase